MRENLAESFGDGTVFFRDGGGRGNWAVTKNTSCAAKNAKKKSCKGSHTQNMLKNN